ncbi:MAG TPA: hypothetical protein VFU43_23000 [Streptosporangiaceae bacterium]|nr:hypothetical protein [Streptosporangiaceae bacterium]
MTGAVAGGPSPAGGKRRMPGPSRPLVAAIAVACAGTLLAGVGYAVSARPAAAPNAAGGSADRVSDRPGAPLDLAAVNAILERRARAVRAGDRAGFLAAVDSAFRPEQEALFDNLRGLPLATWRQRADPARPDATETAGPGNWTVRVTLRYRLRGFDRGDVTATQYLTFARRPGTGTGAAAGLTIIGDGTAQGRLDDPEIWDGGRLSVVRGGRSLVIGVNAPRTRLRQIAARLDRAVPAVTAVVGPRWARRVVAIVPATPERAAALAGDGGSLREIAALATVTRAAPGARGNDRIVVSPAAYPRLNEVGRHVVLTHELTHVATRGAGDGRTPAWLIEGLADYVGYKGLDVPVTSAARELRREVSRGRLPAALPRAADFSGAAGRLAQVYEEAWLACRMVAERYGEDRLVRLYRAAGARPDGLPDALRRVLGVDTAEFTTMWRGYLRRELG